MFVGEKCHSLINLGEGPDPDPDNCFHQSCHVIVVYSSGRFLIENERGCARAFSIGELKSGYGPKHLALPRAQAS
jgi:hypothetical protein